MSPQDPNAENWSDSDSWLDDQLRAVPLPKGFAERLRWASLVDDEDLDEAVRDVPLPAGLLGRLRLLARRRHPLARLSDLATAVSLLVAIGVSYVGAMVLLLMAVHASRFDTRPQLASQTDRIELEMARLEPAEAASLEFLATVSDDEAMGPLPPTESVPVSPLLLSEGQFLRRRTMSELADILTIPSNRPGTDSATFRRWGVFGSHNMYDALDELEKVPGLSPRGIDPPLVRGFPLAAFIRHGVFPFVSPSADQALRYSEAPLGVNTSSFDLTRRYLDDGMLPAPEVVRTEEFLAAVDYDFPAPSRSGLRLTTAAGPSPFGGENMRLLQFGVKAPAFRDAGREGAHLVLAVDVSTSMRWGGRLEMVRRCIGQLTGQLGDDDRISVVTFSENAHLLIENASKVDAEAIVAAVESMAVENSTNVGTGLRQAFAVARYQASEQDMPTSVVLLTDGLGKLDGNSLARIESRLRDEARDGIRLDVIDLGQEQEPDRQLSLIAEAAGGKVHRTASAEGIRWAMLEILTGKSQLMAAGARLQVTFNPKTVLAYRLLGHEAKALAGLMPAKPGTDFHCDQSATVVYEVLLKQDTGGEVASAELTWNNPDGSEASPIVKKVDRGQFAKTWLDSPLSLQMATIAAETAEILRHSPFVDIPPKDKGKALDRALLVAGQADTRLFNNPSFVGMLNLIDEARKARPYRNVGRRR